MIGPNARRGIGGGAFVTLWYAYDSAWQQLRERSEWIEMGIGTPQLDAHSYGEDLDQLVRYVSEESGVLAVAPQQLPLALTVEDREHRDPRLLVVGGPL
jgi:hypothetical protein